jgi:hypothetical protein
LKDLLVVLFIDNNQIHSSKSPVPIEDEKKTGPCAFTWKVDGLLNSYHLDKSIHVMEIAKVLHMISTIPDN